MSIHLDSLDELYLRWRSSKRPEIASV